MRTLQATLLAALLLIAASAYARDSIVTKESIPGATLHIEVRQPVTKHKAAEIIEWLRSTSSHISLAYGRFPNPSPHVVVIPTQDRAWGSDSPVPFGRVTRNGEERIELYVDAERPIEEYYDDWTATHEFSHLMLPYVGERHRWISEGFASYYQNVLMSRAGPLHADEQAWQKLYSGFERGRLSRPDLTSQRGGERRRATGPYENLLEWRGDRAAGRYRAPGAFRRARIARRCAGSTATVLPAVAAHLERARAVCATRCTCRRRRVHASIQTLRKQQRISGRRSSARTHRHRHR